jgi:hypothetical protein
MEENEIDWQQFKCRCSSIHMILANSQSNPCLTEKMLSELSSLEAKEVLTTKEELKLAELLVRKDNGSKLVLSDTCIGYLMEEYAWKTEGMTRITKGLMDVPQLEKGKAVEADSLKLLSIVDGIEYKANIDKEGKRERVYNDFLSGEVDAYVGDSIMTATILPDIKSVWDYPTFLCKMFEPLSRANDLQVKGYMDISGAREGLIANCLVNMPEDVVFKQKWKLLNMMNVATDESPEFLEVWEILERSMKFDKIPVHKRVHKKAVNPMTNEQKSILYDRVKVCRDYLSNFHETYNNLNL